MNSVVSSGIFQNSTKTFFEFCLSPVKVKSGTVTSNGA